MTVRVVLNRTGIARFLRDQKSNPKMTQLLQSEGRKLAARAGNGFVVEEMKQRKNRPGVRVYPETKEAQRLQANTNALGRALGGAAGRVEYVSKQGKVSYITEKQAANYRSRRG